MTLLNFLLSTCPPGGAVRGSQAQRGSSAAGEGSTVRGAEMSPGTGAEHRSTGAETPQNQREGQVLHVHRYDS